MDGEHGDLELPGAVITTHCVSSVIRPGRRNSRDPLQFVKIHSADLSQKAVEQIRLAEEVKITKEKIKEVEEEWQSNLLNWKSKRRSSNNLNNNNNGSSNGSTELLDQGSNESDDATTRKVKTFTEILSEKAKSGHRLGYNLRRYVAMDDEEEEGGGRGEEEGENDNDNEEEEEEEENAIGMIQAQNPHRTDCEEEAKKRESNVSPEAGCEKEKQQLEQQKNVWNYLLQQQQENDGYARRIHADEMDPPDEDEEEEEDDIRDVSQEQGEEQLIKFKAKLSAFENLSRSQSSQSETTTGHVMPAAACAVGGQGSGQEVPPGSAAGSQQESANHHGRYHAATPSSSSSFSSSSSSSSSTASGHAKLRIQIEQQQQQPLTNSSPSCQPSESLFHKQRRENHLLPDLPHQVNKVTSVLLSPPPLYLHPNPSRSLNGFTGLPVNNHLSQQIQHLGQQNNNHNNNSGTSRYNVNHWVIQEAELRRQIPSTSSSSAAAHLQSNAGNKNAVIFSSNNNNSAHVFHSQPSNTSPASTATTAQSKQVSSLSVAAAAASGAAPIAGQVNHYPMRLPQQQQQQQQQEQIYENFNSNQHQRHNRHHAASVSGRENGNPSYPDELVRGCAGMVIESPSSSSSSHSASGQRMFLIPQNQQQPFITSSNAFPPAAVAANVNHHQHQHQHQQQPQGQHSDSLLVNTVSYAVLSPPPLQPPPLHLHPNPSIASSFSVNGLPVNNHLPQQIYPGQYNNNNSNNSNTGTSRYNANHWLIQEAELRRQIPSASFPAAAAHLQSNGSKNASHVIFSQNNDSAHVLHHHPQQLHSLPPATTSTTTALMPQSKQVSSSSVPVAAAATAGAAPSAGQVNHHPVRMQQQEQIYENFNSNLNPTQQQQQPQLCHHQHNNRHHAASSKQSMLSVSGRKKCSSCSDELGRGCAAMVIESLSLYYHINCFRCSVCHIQLGNGTCGTDVRVRNHKLHCNNCYSNDEAGLKFSRV